MQSFSIKFSDVVLLQLPPFGFMKKATLIHSVSNGSYKYQVPSLQVSSKILFLVHIL